MRREQYGHQAGGYRRGTVNSVEPPRAGSLTGSRRRHRPAAAPVDRSCGSPAPRCASRPGRPTRAPPSSRCCPVTCPRRAALVHGALAEVGGGPASSRRDRRPRPSRATAVHSTPASDRWPGSTCSTATSLEPRCRRHRHDLPSGASGAPSGRSWPPSTPRLPPFWHLGIDGHRRRPPGHAVQPDAGGDRRGDDRSSATPCSAAAAGAGFVQRLAVDPGAPGPGPRPPRSSSTACAGCRPGGARRPRQHPGRQRPRARALPPLGFRLQHRAAGRARPLARQPA